jgi:hypothetical protein
MSTTPKPLFLFLLPVVAQPLPEQAPFLAVVSTDGKNTGFLIEDDGGTVELGGDTGNAILEHVTRKGITGVNSLHMDMTYEELAGCFVEGLAFVLHTLVADGTDADALDESMPSVDDVFGEGAVARTRDAAVWLTNKDFGHRAPIELGAYVDPLVGLDVGSELANHIQRALDEHDPVLAQALDLDGMLDHFLIGVVAHSDSAHATLAQRGRIAEDIRLLPRVWEHTGEDQRPVIPVFL